MISLHVWTVCDAHADSRCEAYVACLFFIPFMTLVGDNLSVGSPTFGL